MIAEVVASTWEEWGRIHTVVEVWRPVVEEICRRHGLSSGAIQAGYPGSNAVFAVDGAFVKIAAPFWPDDFEREQVVYDLLATQTTLPMPRVLARGVVTAGQEWPYFVLTKLPGERIGALWESIPPDNRAAIAAELGRLTRVLHEVSVPNSPLLPSSADAWAQFVRQQIDGCVARHVSRSLPPHLLAQLPDYLAGIDLLPGPGFRPCLLHSDIHEDHVLLSPLARPSDQWRGGCPGSWEITGLIDCGDAQMGDPEYEWVAVGRSALGGDMAAMRTFLDAYGWERRDREFPRRMLTWTLLHRFSDMRPYLERLGGPKRVRALRELEALWPF